MGGFSPEWLALREPADLVARSPVVLQAMRDVFAGQTLCKVCDLGSGTGSSVRAFASWLPRRQEWHLLDHDSANIAAAHKELARWAERSSMEGDRMLLKGQGRLLAVHFATVDLAGGEDFIPEGVDLVSASALFDLASAEWLDRLAERIVTRGLSLLSTLNYDGAMQFKPADPLDGSVVAAFNRHQAGDKGFGPALGPKAGEYLAEKLESLGYKVVTATSPWWMGSADAGLKAATFEGVVTAVAETGAVDPAGLDRWAALRRGNLAEMTVGHIDLFATPA
ncbi:MAG: hypothetical protein RJQ21_02850 [Rhodospirillales bacterium]